ncbi:MAG: hypothetical protein V2B20_26960 [Pseudomonadota bacterium]
MKNFHENYILGEFIPFGGIIYEKLSLETFNTAIEYFYNGKKEANGLFNARSIKEKRDRTSIPTEQFEEYVSSLATYLHERAHFYQIPGTPIGIFLFKTHILRSAFMEYSFLRLKQNSLITGEKLSYVPITLWSQLIQNNIVTSNNGALLKELMGYWDQITQYQNILLGTSMTNIKVAIESLSAFRDQVSKIVDVYFDGAKDVEYPKITSNLDKNSYSIPDKRLSTLSIIEGYAKLIEIQAKTELYDDPNEYIKTGRKYNRVYIDAIDYIFEKLGRVDRQTALGILDFSLFSPIDKLFCPLLKIEVVWEDICPGFRLKKIVDCLISKPMYVEKLDFLSFYEKLSDVLDWPSPTEMLKRIKDIKMEDNQLHLALEKSKNVGENRESRSIAEPYMFKLSNEMADKRLRHKEFVGNPYQILLNRSELIHPFITITAEKTIFGDNLGFDTVDLYASISRYFMLLDAFSSGHDQYFPKTESFFKGIFRKDYNRDFLNKQLKEFFYPLTILPINNIITK